jgi:hypothetical protein
MDGTIVLLFVSAGGFAQDRMVNREGQAFPNNTDGIRFGLDPPLSELDPMKDATDLSRSVRDVEWKTEISEGEKEVRVISCSTSSRADVVRLTIRWLFRSSRRPTEDYRMFIGSLLSKKTNDFVIPKDKCFRYPDRLMTGILRLASLDMTIAP